MMPERAARASVSSSATAAAASCTATSSRTSSCSAFANPVLERLDDAAALAPSGRVAFTTDAHVVQPLRFPGGDIGRLAVAGTVNDLATAAARPLALAAAFVIEEGFALDDLRAVCASMAATAREAGVPIVTGDTKVVERGAADGLFITTTGVGEIVVAHELGSAAVRDGDAVILSGGVGDHAVAILAARGEFDFRADVQSDCAPLWGLVEAAVHGGAASTAGKRRVRFLRDPTRGGLTTVLAELAEESGLGIEVEEEAIPVSPAVRSVCDLLGYDPLTLANEGKMVLVTAAEAADAVVAAVRATRVRARRAADRLRHRRPPRPRRPAHAVRHAPRAGHADRRTAAADLLAPSAAEREEYCGDEEEDDESGRRRGRPRSVTPAARPPRPVMPVWLRNTLVGLDHLHADPAHGAAAAVRRVCADARAWRCGSSGAVRPGGCGRGRASSRWGSTWSACTSPAQTAPAWFLYFGAWIFVIVAFVGEGSAPSGRCGGVDGEGAGPSRSRS